MPPPGDPCRLKTFGQSSNRRNARSPSSQAIPACRPPSERPGGPFGRPRRQADKFTRPPPRREGEGGRTGRAIGHPAGAGYGGIAPAAWLEADAGPIKEAGGARRERGAAAAACTVDALAAKWGDQDELMKVVCRFALD